MSTLKVDAIRHNSATSDSLVLSNDGSVAIGTCTAKLTSVGGAQLSNRNKVINGGMTVSQRGTSFSHSASSAYTVDRFQHRPSGSPTFECTYTQSDDHPDGFSKSLKTTPNTVDTSLLTSDNAMIRYMFEGQDLQDLAYGTSSAKSITLSFYARSGSQNNNHQYSVQFRKHNDGDAARKIVTAAFTVTTSWQRYTFTFAGDTGENIRNDTENGLELMWHLAAGPDDIHPAQSTWSSTTNAASAGSPKFTAVTGQSNFLDNTSNEFYLTGVQLEVGDTATSFEHRNTSEELSRCQRYFYRIGGQSRTYQVVGNGFVGQNGGTKCAKIIVNFPTTMRDRPTLSVIGTDAFKGDTGGAASAMDCTATANTGGMWNDASSTDIAWVDFGRTGGGSPANGTAVVVYTTGAQGEVAFSAEL